MLVDGGADPNLTRTVAGAIGAENAGYSGLWTAETNHDPFLPLTLCPLAITAWKSTRPGNRAET